MLLTAHDLIGAAEPVLSTTDLDEFPDMAELDVLFARRSQMWATLADLSAYKRQIMSSRISDGDAVEAIKVAVAKSYIIVMRYIPFYEHTIF